ncbi:MAG: GFA family protein [Alphaproteobacteria bacterium]|nr:GFA family protein [Alphaproteobacteria bacterium]
MTEARKPVHSGGCQCGAVRFAVYAEPLHSAICHCRMCQKAFGSFFAPFAVVELGQFVWTRGGPTIFASSQISQRGFCNKCGTPLSCFSNGSAEINIPTGSFDHPEKLPPTFQAGIEGRMPWFADMQSLRGKTTDQLMPKQVLKELENRQHPDHDTPAWPPE